MTEPTGLDLPVDPSELEPEVARAIEAVVMVADQPVAAAMLGQLCDISEELAHAHCAALAHQYREANRGFELARVAGGYRFQSHPDQAAVVERFVLDGQSSRLSAAALETLAIVAYKQPISRAQVAAIRGVNVDAVMRTLDQRGYITEIARDPGPGQAALFATTALFLEKLGLDTLDDLPALGDFVPGPEVVEQLEAGLRVAADDHRPESGPHPSAPEPDAGADAPVVDLTDPAAADPVPGASDDEEAATEAGLPDGDPVTAPDPGSAGEAESVPHPGQADAVVIEIRGRPDRRR